MAPARISHFARRFAAWVSHFCFGNSGQNHSLREAAREKRAERTLTHPRFFKARLGQDASQKKSRALRGFSFGLFTLPGQVRRQLFQAAKPPSRTNMINTQAGMESPRKLQSSSAHSPEPVNAMRSASVKGKASSM